MELGRVGVWLGPLSLRAAAETGSDRAIERVLRGEEQTKVAGDRS